MASLRKFEIIARLFQDHGIQVKSTQQLNKILTEMGIIVKDAGFWRTTAKGLPFSIYSRTQVLNGDLWREHIVDAIAKFVKSK